MTRESDGIYCVSAPGIDAREVPAAVTVDWAGTNAPEGNAAAMTSEFETCGESGSAFRVVTDREPVIDSGAGVDVSGPAVRSNTVAFTIVIP